MSGTSGALLQKSQLCYVSTRTSQNPSPVNDLDISTFMSNRSNFYGGFSISAICVENNFFNVTSKQTKLIFLFYDDTGAQHLLDLYLEPNFYDFTQMKAIIAEGMKQVITTYCNQNGINVPDFVAHPLEFGDHDSKYNGQSYGRIICPTYANEYAIRIIPFEEGIIGAQSTLSEVLGFIKTSWTYNRSYDGVEVQADGFITASDFHSLDRHSMLYLHSEALKHNSTYDGKGSTTNMIQVVHNGEEYANFVNYKDEMSTYEPHFIFSQVRDLSVIDFSLRDEKGELLETPTNNLHIVFRLFY